MARGKRYRALNVSRSSLCDATDDLSRMGRIDGMQPAAGLSLFPTNDQGTALARGSTDFLNGLGNLLPGVAIGKITEWLTNTILCRDARR